MNIEEAKKALHDLPIDSISEFTKSRLTKDSFFSGSGHAPESSEDVVIALLKDPDLSDEVRTEIISGCEKVYAILLGWLACPESIENITLWNLISTKLCKVVDITAPSELTGHAFSFLTLVLPKGEQMPEVLQAAVRACMSFKNEANLPIWEGIIKSYPSVAAYAFSAILSLTSERTKITSYLVFLWNQEITNQWPVDTAFMMRRVAKKSNGANIIKHAISILSKEMIWLKIKEILEKRKWSNSWLLDIELEVSQNKDLVASFIGSYEPLPSFESYCKNLAYFDLPKVSRSNMASIGSVSTRPEVTLTQQHKSVVVPGINGMGWEKILIKRDSSLIDDYHKLTLDIYTHPNNFSARKTINEFIEEYSLDSEIHLINEIDASKSIRRA